MLFGIIASSACSISMLCIFSSSPFARAKFPNGTVTLTLFSCTSTSSAPNSMASSATSSGSIPLTFMFMSPFCSKFQDTAPFVARFPPLRVILERISDVDRFLLSVTV